MSKQTHGQGKHDSALFLNGEERLQLKIFFL